MTSFSHNLVAQVKFFISTDALFKHDKNALIYERLFNGVLDRANEHVILRFCCSTTSKEFIQGFVIGQYPTTFEDYTISSVFVNLDYTFTLNRVQHKYVDTDLHYYNR